MEVVGHLWHQHSNCTQNVCSRPLTPSSIFSKFPSGTQEQLGWQCYLGRVLGSILWTLVSIFLLWGVLWSLFPIHNLGQQDTPKRSKPYILGLLAWLWFQEGGLTSDYPSGYLSLSLLIFHKVESQYKCRHTDFDDSQLGDTGLELWVTHGPLPTLGLPHVVSVCWLLTLHVSIYNSLWCLVC